MAEICTELIQLLPKGIELLVTGKRLVAAVGNEDHIGCQLIDQLCHPGIAFGGRIKDAPAISPDSVASPPKIAKFKICLREGRYQGRFDKSQLPVAFKKRVTQQHDPLAVMQLPLRTCATGRLGRSKLTSGAENQHKGCERKLP